MHRLTAQLQQQPLPPATENMTALTAATQLTACQECEAQLEVEVVAQTQQ